MTRKPYALLCLSLAFTAQAPVHARAGELFGGVYAHSVDTPLSLSSGEGGADIELGFRGTPIAVLKDGGGPAPYGFVSVNTAGHTDFIAAGLAWKVDLGPVYVRPGVGLSLNNGPDMRVDANGTRTDLGSKVLFEPEIGIGVSVNERVSLEASWVHISGARLFNSEQNPGIDMFGLRINYAL